MKRLRIPGWMITAAMVGLGGNLLLAQSPASATQPAPAEAEMTFLQLLVKGGWFMVPIAITSLIGLALILERFVALRRGRIIPPRFMRALKSFDNSDAALAYCREHDSPIARVVAVGLRKLPQGIESVEQAIEDAGANEVHKLRKNLRMLYGVSAVAPMLGLLGTVWGMIEAFRVTSAAKGLGKPELLAKGIYEALVTTLAGLLVAIPVLMFYYYFVGKIERTITELNDASEDFVEHFAESKIRN